MTTNTELAVTGRYSEVEAAAYDRAMAACRGCYQRALVRGAEAMSGATLTGAAKSWSRFYRRSAARLIERLCEAGLDAREIRRDHGRRVLAIGVES